MYTVGTESNNLETNDSFFIGMRSEKVFLI